MTFQALYFKENHFLELLDNKYLLVNPTYIKGGSWLKQIEYLNSLCAKATRIVTNHASIREYRLRFLPRENFSYLYKTYPIELKCYILYKCKRYNNFYEKIT